MKKTELLEKKVFTYCETNRMLSSGDCVVVGVSGGADSVCLLFLLCAFREKLSLSLKVVHVNHGIRQDAQADADYVRKLCERLKVPYDCVETKVRELAGREGISEEEAGRKVRYQVFAECATSFPGRRPSTDEKQPIEDKLSAKNPLSIGDAHSTGDMPSSAHGVKIALAHHMGDRAETLLFHLFRGSGLKGAGSIAPVRETKEGFLIIRPLLCLTREEIEDYLSEKGVPFCQDYTNLEDEYARNRIRHHIIPYAQAEICPGAVRHLNEFAELVSDTERYLREQTLLARRVCVIEANDSRKTVPRIQVTSFLQTDPLLQKRLLLELLKEISPGQKDIGAVHVEAVLELFHGESGRRKALPFGIIARREYDQVILERMDSPDENRQRASEREALELSPSSLLEKGCMEVKWGGFDFLFEVFPHEKNAIIPEKTYTKWFDYDKIKNTLQIRTRKTGDFLLIRGSDGRTIRKTIKDYMITEKLPRSERDCLPLLAQGQEVLWITGYRINESYKVDEGTKRILQVTCQVPRNQITEDKNG